MAAALASADLLLKAGVDLCCMNLYDQLALEREQDLDRDELVHIASAEEDLQRRGFLDEDFMVHGKYDETWGNLLEIHPPPFTLQGRIYSCVACAACSLDIIFYRTNNARQDSIQQQSHLDGKKHKSSLEKLRARSPKPPPLSPPGKDSKSWRALRAPLGTLPLYVDSDLTEYAPHPVSPSVFDLTNETGSSSVIRLPPPKRTSARGFNTLHTTTLEEVIDLTGSPRPLQRGLLETPGPPTNNPEIWRDTLLQVDTLLHRDHFHSSTTLKWSPENKIAMHNWHTSLLLRTRGYSIPLGLVIELW
jgi:hypothetical protein